MSTPPLFEFGLIADTHYMLDSGSDALEFESRRLQTRRTRSALDRLAELDLPLVIHMGDLVQEFPERPNFPTALAEALTQIEDAGLDPVFVAGNHDVGDKPDPTMPADPVEERFLDLYHEQVGPSWQSWDQAGLHFVVLNSQIMNSNLDAARQQADWFETDLQAAAGKRIFVFLHLPPFLYHEDEAALGHYDNIDEPARFWLLTLLARYEVEALFCAHVHFAFINQVGPTTIWTVPSVAFTRPGFGELFSSGPAPEQGRDDRPKLGFYVVKVYAKGHRVCFVRTGGSISSDSATVDKSRPAALRPVRRPSPLGVVLHHPLTQFGQTPSVWPSSIRQPVRNDYPLLLLRELGVGHIILPGEDLHDPLQRTRLSLLRDEGVTLIGSWLWNPANDIEQLVEAASPLLDEVLFYIPGALSPPADLLRMAHRIQSQKRISVIFAPILPGRKVSGKQHPRSQIGFSQDGLASLSLQIRESGSFLCRVERDGEFDQWSRSDFPHAGEDWIFRPPDLSTEMHERASRLALEAVLETGQGRIFFEPFLDLDRTMDRALGLIDRLCNPRSAFYSLRDLNRIDPIHIDPNR